MIFFHYKRSLVVATDAGQSNNAQTKLAEIIDMLTFIRISLRVCKSNSFLATNDVSGHPKWVELSNLNLECVRVAGCFLNIWI